MQEKTKKFEVTVKPEGSTWFFKEYIELPSYAGAFNVVDVIKAKYGKNVQYYGITEVK